MVQNNWFSEFQLDDTIIVSDQFYKIQYTQEYVYVGIPLDPADDWDAEWCISELLADMSQIGVSGELGVFRVSDHQTEQV